MRLYVFVFWWSASSGLVALLHYEFAETVASHPHWAYIVSTFILYGTGHVFGNDE